MKIVYINNSPGGLAVFRGPMIRRLLQDGIQVVTISPPGKELSLVRTMGAKVYEIEFHSQSVSIVKNLTLIRKIKTVLSIENPDVVQTFTHKANIVGCIAARWAGVQKIYVTLTGLGTLFIYDDVRSRAIRILLLYIYQILNRYIKKYIFQNPDDRREFLALAGIEPRNTILVNGSGIDIGDYPIHSNECFDFHREMLAEEIGISNLRSKHIILLVARATRSKGVSDFYRAAELIGAISKDFVFLHLGGTVVGVKDGYDAEYVDSLAKECGVIWLGTRPDIRRYQMASDAIVLPSMREGVPRALIEAAALGKPIVANDVPGCREVVIHGENGFLVKPREIGELAFYIWLTRGNLPRASVVSRRLAEEKFDVSLQYRQMVEEYES